MNYLKKFLYNGCAYTVLISIAFYLFALALSLTDATLSIGRFFTIVLLAFIISVAEFIFRLNSLHTVIKYIVHYLVIFASFFIVFLTVKTEDGTPFSPSFIFSALAIFTVCYGIVLGTVKLTKHIIKKHKNRNSRA